MPVSLGHSHHESVFRNVDFQLFYNHFDVLGSPRLGLLLVQGSCSFSNADIFQNHFNCLFTIFIQNLEFLAEVIEDLSVGSVAIGRNEVDFAISAELVDFQLLFMGHASSNNHLEPAHQGKI